MKKKRIKIIMIFAIIFIIFFPVSNAQDINQSADTGLFQSQSIPDSTGNEMITGSEPAGENRDTIAFAGTPGFLVNATDLPSGFQIKPLADVNAGIINGTGIPAKTSRVIPADFFTTDPVTSQEYVTGQVIVRYNTKKFQNPLVLNAYLVNSHAKSGAQVEEDFSNTGLPGMQVVRLPPSVTVNDAIREYRKNPDILYAEPNYRIYLIDSMDNEPAGILSSGSIAATTPNDTQFSTQWYLHNPAVPDADIHAPEAWDISQGSNSVIVGIIDTGMDYTHPDLAGNVWTNSSGDYGWNFTSGANNNLTFDHNSHGTHIAGTIGAKTNNGAGVAGVSWHVRLMPLKIFETSGSYTATSDAINAIQYADAMGAVISSNSWGGPSYSQSLKDAIDASPQLFVCAAGNNAVNTDNITTPNYPSGYNSPNIISVAATDQNDIPASFTNYGPISVDIAAPGVDVYNTIPGGSYGYKSGTSMATPQVSGVAALVRSTNPRLSNTQIRNVILNNVDVLTSLSGRVNTSGRLNSYKAVLAAQRIAGPQKIGIYRNGSWYLDINGDGVWNAGDRNTGFGALLWTPAVGDWNGDGITKIGVYRDGVWYLDYDNSGTWSSGDKNYGYGAPNWTPVTGDWNGNGIEKIGVYKEGAWYLDYDGSGTWNEGDKNYAFGGAGWTPVIGKWTSDGQTKIGVYKDGVYYIDYNGDGYYGAGDKTIMYGITGSNAITGDWNTNGLTEIGTKSGSVWRLDYDGLGAVNASTKSYTFGAAAWNPVIGDWNADGKDKIGIYLNGAWYLDYDGSGAWNASSDRNYAFGTTGWIPLVGKWS